MDYTRELHEALKKQVQALLNQLIQTARIHGLEMDANMLLTAPMEGNGIIEICLDLYEIRGFFSLKWRNKPGKLNSYLKLSYDPATNLVVDTVKFNDNGKPLGHIQCWYDNQPDQLSFLAKLLDQLMVIELDGKWSLVEYSESKLKPR